MIRSTTQLGALVLCLAIIATACGRPDDGASSQPNLNFEFIAAGLDFPIVSSPPTADPSVDPSTPEPRVVLSPVFVNAVEVTTGTETLEVRILGDLPTPCHRFRFEVSNPDPERLILLNLWSEADTDEICIQVTEPFAESLEVGGLGEGVYTIMIGGKKLGEIRATVAPAQ